MAMLSARRQGGQQIEALEDEADVVPPKARAVGVRHLAEIVAIHQHLAAGGAGQAAQDVQQGGLPASGRPHHGHELALLDNAIHAPQRFHLDFAEAVDFLQVASAR